MVELSASIENHSVYTIKELLAIIRDASIRWWWMMVGIICFLHSQSYRLEPQNNCVYHGRSWTFPTSMAVESWLQTGPFSGTSSLSSVKHLFFVLGSTKRHDHLPSFLIVDGSLLTATSQPWGLPIHTSQFVTVRSLGVNQCLLTGHHRSRLTCCTTSPFWSRCCG